jgi:hypothetical protein
MLFKSITWLLFNVLPDPIVCSSSVRMDGYPPALALGEVGHSSSPLNRLVDAVAPESETARKFSDLAKLIVAGKATPQQRQAVRNSLVLWRDFSDSASMQAVTRVNAGVPRYSRIPITWDGSFRSLRHHRKGRRPRNRSTGSALMLSQVIDSDGLRRSSVATSTK